MNMDHGGGDDLFDQFTKCENAGMGLTTHTYYRGTRVEPHGEPPDVAFYLKRPDPDGFRLYGMFTGFNGTQRAKYVANNLGFQILFDAPHQISAADTNERILDIMRESFYKIEKAVVDDIKECLSMKTILADTAPSTSVQFPDIDTKLQAGTTALLALKIERRLLVMNCGNSRVLLLSMLDNTYHCEPLNDIHNTWNPHERARLEGLGVNPDEVRLPTRGMGDAFHKFGYSEKGFIIAEPEVFQYDIDPSFRYLVIASDGVYKTLQDFTKEQRPEADINKQIMEYVLHEMRHDLNPSLTSTAQASLDLIGRIHHDKFVKGDIEERHRDGMALILVDLGTDCATEYPVSSLLDTQLSDRNVEEEVDAYADLIRFDTIDSKDEVIAELQREGLFDETLEPEISESMEF